MAGTRHLPRLLTLLIAASCSLLAAAAPASAGAVQARASDAVVESIGVNTHLGYTDTPYNNFSMVRQRLRELGIRYIRDGISLKRPDVYARVRTLAGDGIRLNVIAGDPLRRWNFGTIDQQLDMIQTELADAVVSIEGPNEYDLQGDPNWVSVLRSYTKELWEGVKARPKLASLPVVGPSIVLRENMKRVGDLTPWIDYGNTHTYLSGDIPERDSIWDGELGAAASNSGSAPVQTTETGYHNAINGTVGHQPCSERAAGIYMPRLFLENFRRGIARSFSYEFMDQRPDASKTDIEAAFGLLRHDFSKKPAAVAIERLIDLMADPGPGFEPGELGYELIGAPSTAQQLLLQKRDGTFLLALWNRVSVWNVSKRTDIDPADVPVTVRFDRPIARAAVHVPNASAEPIATASDASSIKLDLSERVTVLELTPAPEPEPEPLPLPKPDPTPEPEPEVQPDPQPQPQPLPEPEPQPEAEPEPQPEASPAPRPEPDPAPPSAPSTAPPTQGEDAARSAPAPSRGVNARRGKARRSKAARRANKRRGAARAWASCIARGKDRQRACRTRLLQSRAVLR